MAEQTGTGYQSPYKFNGKELDPETGLYYYGTRYYDPHSSTWLSVDPLAEKYAGWTPYNYCVGNPVVFVDPDGSDVDPTSNGYDDATSAAKKQKSFAEIFQKFLNNKDIVVKFVKSDDPSVGGTISYDGENDKGQKIYSAIWNPSEDNNLGTSGLYEESYHLMEAIEGVEMNFTTPGNGCENLDIYDEVRAKQWVVNNIKGINKYKNLEIPGYKGYTHYGYIGYLNDPEAIKKNLMEGSPSLNGIEKDINANFTDNGLVRVQYNPPNFNPEHYKTFSPTVKRKNKTE